MTVAAPQRILYVVSQWRAPTQTFVRREVDAARAAGRDVVVLSLKRPVAADRADPEIVHLSRPSIAISFLLVALRHPWRVAVALARSGALARPRTLVPNVGATVVGVAATRHVSRVDWVHAHFAWVAASAADALATVRRQPFSVFAHAHDVFDAKVLDRYTGSKLRRSSFVAVESESIRLEVDARFRCRSTVARMGVTPAFLERPVAASGRLTRPLVVSVGSLVPKKGHDDLLRAVAGLPAEVRLMVAGEGPEAADLASLAADLGIDDRVSWLGAVAEDRIADILDGAAVFCLASKPTPTGDRDGVPNVLVEAMGRGVPCVSTSVSGIPDLLGHGRGIVVDPADVDALRDALERVLADPPAAAAMAARGRAHIAEHYRTDRNWRLLEQRMRVDAREPARA